MDSYAVRFKSLRCHHLSWCFEYTEDKYEIKLLVYSSFNTDLSLESAILSPECIVLPLSLL